LTNRKITVDKYPEEFNQSFLSIMGPKLLGNVEEALVVLNDRNSDASITKPKQFGSHKSKFITTLLKEHHGVNLSKDDWYALVTWVDYNAPYHGRLINKYPADGSFARREVYTWPDLWQNNTITPAISEHNILPRPVVDTTLLVSDPLMGKILRYNTAGEIKWEYKTDSCTDIHLLENGNIVIAEGSFVKEVDRRGKAILKYHNSGIINSCQPLLNGYTLAADSRNNQLLMLNRKMKLERTIPLEDNNKSENDITSVRIGTQGTYFIAKDKEQFVGEYSESGKLLRRIAFGSNVSCLEPMSNGNLIIGGKGGIKIVDQKNNIAWSLKPEDLPEVNLQTVSNILLLPYGNLLVANKIENQAKNKGLKLFEVNQNKKLRKTFSKIKINETPKCMTISGVYYDLSAKIKHRVAGVDK